MTLNIPITDRKFPSIFEAWFGTTNQPTLNTKQVMAEHGLVWQVPVIFGWHWKDWKYRSETLVKNTAPPEVDMAELVDLNPDIKVLIEINHYDLKLGDIPDDDPWWLLDANGHKIVAWVGDGFVTYRLNNNDPSLQAHICAQAKAIMATIPFVKGLFFDWMEPQSTPSSLMTTVRKAVGEEALIVANCNYVKMPTDFLAQIDGVDMEGGNPQSSGDWKAIMDVLDYNEAHVRGHCNCLEIWSDPAIEDTKRVNLATTLAATHSNGYVLVSIPNYLPDSDHRHKWQPLWDKKLGKATTQPYTKNDGKAWVRTFEGGWAVYNPIGAPSFTWQGTKVAGGDGAIILRA
jgi:hypothetical protein